MDRKEFLQHACGMGLCSCAVASVIATATGTVRAGDETDAPTPAPAKPEDDWRIPFVEERYARMLGLIATQTDEKTLNTILEGVGRYCASTADFVPTHAGDPEGFVAALRERWKANVSYDPEKRAVSLAFPTGDECPCPLVKKGVTPPAVCNCSLGWQKHAFEIVFGQPVEVTLTKSLLHGDDRCAFEIRVPGTAPA